MTRMSQDRNYDYDTYGEKPEDEDSPMVRLADGLSIVLAIAAGLACLVSVTIVTARIILAIF